MAKWNLSAENPTETTESSRGVMMAIGLAIAALGLALSLYTLSHHLELKSLGSTNAFCNINETFSCDDIAKSPYSEVFGLPLGVLGAGYFLSILTLLMTGYLKPQYLRDSMQAYRLLIYAGVAAAVVLAILSFVVIGKGCLNCIGVYILCLGQGGLAVAFRDQFFGRLDLKAIGNGLTFAAIPFALAIGAYSLFKPAPSNFHADVPQGAAPSGDENPASAGGSNLVLSPKTVDIEIHRSAYSGFGEDYRVGPDDAKVVIVEFADFQCPACLQAYKLLKDLKLEFGSQIQVVFKNYPLDMKCNKAMTRKMHEFACDAAAVARCAGMKGKFFVAHDLMFENQSELSTAKIKDWGRQSGLTENEVDECLKSEDSFAKLKDDIAQGDKIGVDSTPTLFINGRKVVGARGDDSIRRVISELLSE